MFLAATADQIQTKHSHLSPEAAADVVANTLLQERHKVWKRSIKCVYIDTFSLLGYSFSFGVGFAGDFRSKAPPLLLFLMATSPAHNHGQLE